ncbi:MAG TPA: helix-turn-helix domain-containing protein [Sphingobium sp.]|nr:helix-turn-helix domain-containing protein [Sphingobium sp.]
MVAVQHDQDGKDRILDAARSLFNQHGFHQTPIAELAASAQVSVGQIYRRFKSKEDIIDAIVEADSVERSREMTSLRARLEAGEIDIDQTFDLLLHLVVDQHAEALSFDILAEAFRNPKVGLTVRDMCGDFRRLIRDFACLANPRLSGEALDAAEEMILACLFGLGHRSLSRPRLDADRTAAGAARMIVAALRAMD